MSDGNSPPHTTAKRIAVVGGGLTGTSIALHLKDDPSLHVHLFDWGRQPGGRAAHRELYLDHEGHETFTPSELTQATLAFDHGLQSIKTNDIGFIHTLRQDTTDAFEWMPRCGWLEQGQYHPRGSTPPTTAPTSLGGSGFLSVLEPHSGSKTFIARNGLSALCSNLQHQATNTGHVHVHQMRRVVGLRRTEPTALAPQQRRPWTLDTDDGHHEQSARALEAQDTVVEEDLTFDAVVFTEHMMWLPAWHPCSLCDNLNPAAVQWVRTQLCYNEESRRFDSVAALFTLMVAFKDTDASRACRSLQFDDIDTACIVQENGKIGEGKTGENNEKNVLQYVVNQRCRKGVVGKRDGGTDDNDEGGEGGEGGGEGVAVDAVQCWVLVSTREFADECLKVETMSRLKTATTAAESSATSTSNSNNITYVPQEEKYLRSDPAERMLSCFYRAMGIVNKEQEPVVVYQRCQRWGGAYTTPSSGAQRREMVEENTRKRAARQREEESALALRKQREKNNMDNYSGVKRTMASNRRKEAERDNTERDNTERDTGTDTQSTTAPTVPQRSSVLEHGHLWEIVDEKAVEKAVEKGGVGSGSRGSGLYCAGDYIYPSSFSPASDTGSPTVVSSFLDRHAERAFVRYSWGC